MFCSGISLPSYKSCFKTHMIGLIVVCLHADMHLTNAAEYASIILSCHTECIRHETNIVSAHRRILGMASVVCVSVKICVSSISLYKLDPDKLTTPFESAHQFTLLCTVSDSKTVPGCHYNSCSKSQFCSD